VPALRPVDLDFVRTAPRRWAFETIVPAERERVFAALSGDPAAWKDWFPGISSGAYEGTPGVGAARVVTVRGMSFFETVLAWDEPSRWTFRVDRSNVPIAKALVEDWTFEQLTNGTRTRWTFCYEPTVLTTIIGPLQKLTMKRLFVRAMRNLGERLNTSSG
jgi:hypothetical protein